MRKLAAFTVSFALGICLAQYLLPERLLLPVAAVFFAAACLALLLPGLWRKRVLLVDGEPVKLTATELKIVDLLMRNLGRVFPAEEIYRRVWNEEAYATENTVMVHIRRIREKIELNPKEPEYLKVVWGIGYKIEKR